MSYKTNPVFNRLKILKGWKNPYLPTKTLNYTRDISLWFKVYLLLKLFLNLKKIQLISCEIRFEQQNKKILYLVLHKGNNPKKKKNKKKRISLKQKLTPIRKSVNVNSKFFLYQNLNFLKQISFWNHNVIHKKVLTKFWLTKPKNSTWINNLEKITTVRQNLKIKFKFWQKNKNWIPTQYLKSNFYKKKQKQIWTKNLRIKKKSHIIFAKFLTFSQQKKSQILQKFIFHLKKKISKNQFEMQEINKIYEFLSCVNQNFDQKKKSIFLKNFQRQKLNILKKAFKSELSSWNRTRFLKKKLPDAFAKKEYFEKKKLPRFLTKLFPKNSDVYRSYLKKTLHLNFLIDQIQNKESLEKKHYFSSQKKIFWNQFLIKNMLKSRFRRIAKKKRLRFLFYKIKLWFLLRNKKKKNKKKQLRNLKKNFKIVSKKKLFQKHIFFWNLKRLKKSRIKSRFQKNLKRLKKSKIKSRFQKNIKRVKKSKIKSSSQKNIKRVKKSKIKSRFQKNIKRLKKSKIKSRFQKNIKRLKKSKIKSRLQKNIKRVKKSLKKKSTLKNYQYRLPPRKNYFNFLQFTAKLKLKFLIQDFVKKYFSLQVETKILHFLNEHKNHKYFRLVFPVWKKKRKQWIKKFRRKSWKQKKIFFKNQLKLATSIKKSQQKKKTTFLAKTKITKTKTKTKKTKITIKLLKKKNLYILSRKKKRNRRISNSFKRIKHHKDFRHGFKHFIPALIYFSKTLEPRFLVNLLSKVLHQAKKQTWMLSSIKNILKFLPLGKNVGYKIALSGRINSSDKSRLIYITRKNVPLQVFDKNINYAFSQAKTRIGVFGVKIWVYF